MSFSSQDLQFSSQPVFFEKLVENMKATKKTWTQTPMEIRIALFVF